MPISITSIKLQVTLLVSYSNVGLVKSSPRNLLTWHPVQPKALEPSGTQRKTLESPLLQRPHHFGSFDFGSFGSWQISWIRSPKNAMIHRLRHSGISQISWKSSPTKSTSSKRQLLRRKRCPKTYKLESSHWRPTSLITEAP